VNRTTFRPFRLAAATVGLFAETDCVALFPSAEESAHVEMALPSLPVLLSPYSAKILLAPLSNARLMSPPFG
jgi:hypothetical protein